jgi:galactonate dehydratase
MKIHTLETCRCAEFPNLLLLRVHAGQGLIGCGETYYLPGACESVVHDLLAGYVLGQSAFDRELHWNSIFGRINNSGYAGAEMRAVSALDIALWDLLGQAAGLPIYNLLGGRCREDIRAYNTCVNGGAYQDQTAFLTRPGELACELLSRGISAMKIWPWDRFAPQTAAGAIIGPAGRSVIGMTGSYLSAEDLQRGLQVIREIREAAGARMEILIEGHGRWDLNAAVRIGKALQPFDVLWMEDMIKPDNAGDLARLRKETGVPVCVSERLFTRFAYREVLERCGADIIMSDVVWTGGITEAHKIAILADAFHLPFTAHDCTGLITLFANLHLSAALPNAMFLETVRGFYEGWYRQVYTGNIVVRDGRVGFPDGPGLGVAIREDFLGRPDVTIRKSSIA